MIGLVAILAVLIEPPEAITEQPWNYCDPIEFIEQVPFEEVEKELNRKRIRIMEVDE